MIITKEDHNSLASIQFLKNSYLLRNCNMCKYNRTQNADLRNDPRFDTPLSASLNTLHSVSSQEERHWTSPLQRKKGLKENPRRSSFNRGVCWPIYGMSWNTENKSELKNFCTLCFSGKKIDSNRLIWFCRLRYLKSMFITQKSPLL